MNLSCDESFIFIITTVIVTTHHFAFVARSKHTEYVIRERKEVHLEKGKENRE